MPDTRIVSNKVVEVRVGVDSAIADVTAPKITELNALVTLNEVIRWDSFGLNVQASSMESDPVLTDMANAQVRALLQFGGTLSLLEPKPGDAGVAAQAKNLLIKPHTKLVVAIRGMVPIGTAASAGQVWNVYRVVTDAENYSRADTGYSYSVNLRPRGDAGINAIVPAATAGAVTITPVGGATATVGAPKSFKAVYQGVDVTVGAKWASSDSTKLEILPHGWAIPKAAGSASISATYPGSAAGTPVSITVS